MKHRASDLSNSTSEVSILKKSCEENIGIRSSNSHAKTNRDDLKLPEKKFPSIRWKF